MTRALSDPSSIELNFVRGCARRVHGIPPEQVVGTAGGTKYGHGKDGKPFLTKDPLSLPRSMTGEEGRLDGDCMKNDWRRLFPFEQ